MVNIFLSPIKAIFIDGDCIFNLDMKHRSVVIYIWNRIGFAKNYKDLMDFKNVLLIQYSPDHFLEV